MITDWRKAEIDKAIEELRLHFRTTHERITLVTILQQFEAFPSPDPRLPSGLACFINHTRELQYHPDIPVEDLAKSIGYLALGYDTQDPRAMPRQYRGLAALEDRPAAREAKLARMEQDCDYFAGQFIAKYHGVQWQVFSGRELAAAWRGR
ncbi:MAG: hypothetical protein V1735_05500 [Nanoarchaeota archaeon]